MIHTQVCVERWGELRDGEGVCHLCNTPLCVNPEHLYRGTQRENYNDNSYGKYASPVSRWQIDPEEAAIARCLIANGMFPRDVADIFGVHPEVLKAAL